MLVVPDILDMFLPLSEGFLVDPVASKSVLSLLSHCGLTLIDVLDLSSCRCSSRYRVSRQGVPSSKLLLEDPCALLPLLSYVLPPTSSLWHTDQVLDSQKATGGQVNIFQTSLPTIGPGALKHREDNKLYGTDKEKTLFIPADAFYRTTAEECVDSGIGVNLFLFPTQYVDVASLGTSLSLRVWGCRADESRRCVAWIDGRRALLPSSFRSRARWKQVEGGDQESRPARDGIQRHHAHPLLQRFVSAPLCLQAWTDDGWMAGLRIADHFGNFSQRNATDLEFGIIDADKAVAARIKHEGKLDEKVDAHFQCAVLYTSAAGQRRVRVHNLAVPVTSLLANVFRFADMDTTLAYIAKDCEFRRLLRTE